VCDLDAALAAETASQFPGAAAHGGMEAMFRETELDGVLVLTSERANAEMARRSLAAGLAVYLEKPPAVSSRELEELIGAEARGPGTIYPAFNRRHTPLFAALDFHGKEWRRVSGALKRHGRPVAKFPHTAIHVIDSAQYFAGSVLEEWKVDFARGDAGSRWTVEGRLANGAACALELIPDGNEFAEYLVLETEAESWTLQFPNGEAAVPEGEIIQRRDGGIARTIRGEKELSSFAAAGFRSCLLDFCRRTGERAKPVHDLSFCRATIAVMEEMEARAGK
jgi:predicted dehydrogenase